MIKRLVSLLAVGSTLIGPAWATDFVHDVQFTAKNPEFVTESAVVRGDRDVYQLNADEGQMLFVTLSSLEHNAALEVAPLVNGKPITGSVEEREQGFCWTGVLPVSGGYRIFVSPTRGNANYHLHISVLDL